MSRDSHLEKVPGFVEFHLLKSPEAEDYTLYASHTVWKTALCLRRGPNRRRSVPASSRAGDNKPLYLDHPQFEGFEVVGCGSGCDTCMLNGETRTMSDIG
jgi:heme-degrading monooxygenase HmoA